VLPTSSPTIQPRHRLPGIDRGTLLSIVSSRGLRRITGAALCGAALLAFASPAGAQDITAGDVQTNLDNVFVLLSAVLVIFMQAGFALVEAGLTQAKNVANIMMKNMMDFCAGALAFYVVGYAIAFGDGNALFGHAGFFLGDGAATIGSLTLPVGFIFQVAFAATAATIVSGAMAERTKFKSYFIYSIVISAFIYPVVVHWLWGGGWLSTLATPYHDFAGSSIVHLTGGVAALMGAKALGPRIGRYGADGKPRLLPPHSIPFAVIGTMILPMAEAYIVDAVRTPVGRAAGLLSQVHPADLGAALGAHSLKALMERTGHRPGRRRGRDLRLRRLRSAQAGDIARTCWLAAGLPEHVPGTTVDRQCGSSQQAVHFAAQAVMSRHVNDLVVAGGVQQMSMIPISSAMTWPSPRLPRPVHRVARLGGALRHPRGEPVPLGAEMIAEKWDISREEMEAFAVESHERALQAQDDGPLRRRDRPARRPHRDEGPREPNSRRSAQLKTRSRRGPITAAVASQISDASPRCSSPPSRR
jgi:hypothetical protein